MMNRKTFCSALLISVFFVNTSHAAPEEYDGVDNRTFEVFNPQTGGVKKHPDFDRNVKTPLGFEPGPSAPPQPAPPPGFEPGPSAPPQPAPPVGFEPRPSAPPQPVPPVGFEPRPSAPPQPAPAGKF